MPLSKYILRGTISAENPRIAARRNTVELLAWLDSEAQKAPSDALAKVKRQYAMNIKKNGLQVEWEKPFLALPAPEVKPNQLLFSFPGVELYELTGA